MANVRDEPYWHDTDTKHTIRVALDRLTTGVLFSIGKTLVEECGNDVTVTLWVESTAGELRIEVST